MAARSQIMPKMTGTCCYTNILYDTKKLENSLKLFASVSDNYKSSDGYQYDLCDLTRQVLSNRFHDNQLEFSKAYKNKNLDLVKEISCSQLQLLMDLDELLSHRSEMCFSRYICDSHSLANNRDEVKYYDKNARTLVTLWGDVRGNCGALYDYSWREWSGLIIEFYYVRWQMFYDETIKNLKKEKRTKIKLCDTYVHRYRYKSYPIGKKINEFELAFCDDLKEYCYPNDSDVVESVDSIITKYNIN